MSPAARALFGVSKLQGLEPRDERGRPDTEKFRCTTRTVNPSLRKLERRGQILSLATPPFTLRNHGLRRFARSQSGVVNACWFIRF